jgi:16S rRNA (cytidine1402-2'-O)-methyltransferase
MKGRTGRLYVVATPIGNLEDMSPRACRILAEVKLIAAEDTRHSGRLLQHIGVTTPMIALHQHNEDTQSRQLLQRLQDGEDIALISDAGTPLLSDPGFDLVRGAREAGIPVYAVPGPSALTAALSVAGLPVDRFVFEGFLPAKSVARQKTLDEFLHETRTVVCYESSHRIHETLADIVAVFGADRRIGIARELTKLHEELVVDSAAKIREWLDADPDRGRGEFVLMIAGVPSRGEVQSVVVGVDDLLTALLDSVPVSEASKLAARISGLKKNALYERALQLQADKDS